MPTIAAGTSATFSIPAGQVATMTAGTGIAVLAFPTSSPMAITAKSVLGPYESTRIVNVAATTAIDYTVAAPSTGTGPSALLGISAKPTVTTPAVAGTSISGTFGAVGTPTPTTAIQWQIDGVDVSGATFIPYNSQASDATKAARFRVTATNSTGSVVAFSDAVTVLAGEGPVATLRQAASGSFVNETVDATNFHAGARLPFTAGVEIPAGTSLRVKFANKAVINNVETNSGGPLNLLAASMEYSGVCTAGVLTQATAAPGAIAFYDVVVPTTIPKGALFWLSYKISNGSGLARFPWYSHSTTNVSKQTISTTGAGVPDQTMVVGGGTWTAVTGGIQSFAIVPVAVEMVHAGKVACVGGSSTGVGRADQGAPGAGVQGYIARAIAALGYPVKCVAVSGDRVVALAASDTFRISQLEGVTHHVIVVGGNDITDGTTAAAMLAGYQSHINHIKAAWPSIKIMVLTLTPVVTGTYDTLGGQTVVASNGVRISANTQIKANVLTGVDKVADINTLGENSFNPEDGKFPVVPGQMTNDGLHYNTLGCSTLSAHPAFAEFMAM